jgi:PhzF family phenazine biosynthesis protein
LWRVGPAMKLRIWQVDAFADRVFAGNPAAVVPLQSWLPDSTLQAIAQENNLAETAFFVRDNGDYRLRWFTPKVEVPLCGHATLASAWVILADLAPHLDIVRFATHSGRLTVERSADGAHRMSFPAGKTELFDTGRDFATALGQAVGAPPPEELYFAPTGAGGTKGIIAIWREGVVRDLQLSGALEPLLATIGVDALLATAKSNSDRYDFVSRFFAPAHGVPEDPVTGSMHATLAPFWARRLHKQELRAFQASSRGGEMRCSIEADRVILSGPCALYLRGEINV